jgi:hypothetical protein
MEIVKQRTEFTVRVYPQKGIVSHQMHGFVEGENFRSMLRAGIAAYLKHGCRSWLSDDSKNPLVAQEDLVWGQNEWEPQILEAGWKFWALVVPEKAFGKMAMRAIIQRYKEKGVTVELFKTYDEALAWLESQSE